jgi:hypothetical protein
MTDNTKYIIDVVKDTQHGQVLHVLHSYQYVTMDYNNKRYWLEQDDNPDYQVFVPEVG